MCEVKKIEEDLRVISDNVIKILNDIEYQKKDIEGLKDSDEKIKKKLELMNVNLNVKMTDLETKVTIGFQIYKLMIFVIFYILFAL